MTVPLAVGGSSPLWPLPDDPIATSVRVSRQFGAPRTDRESGRERYHLAVDLGSARGRRVVAPEDGRVIRAQTFYTTNAGIPTWAVLLALDSGPVVVLGELEPDSIAVAAGQRVARGELVGRVGATDMLHLGTLAPGSTQTAKWWVGDPPPPSVTDPTAWVSSMVDASEPGRLPWRPTLPDWLPRPAPAPTPAPATAGGGGLAVVALLALAAWSWGQA